MAELAPLSRAYPLWGRDVRHAALALLDRCGAMSIRELLEALAADGFCIAGDKAGKTLSDALRHETKRGRAHRVGWGRYAIGRLARTTLWRIRTRWRNATDTDPDECHTTGAPAGRAAQAPAVGGQLPLSTDTWADVWPRLVADLLDPSP